MAEDVLQYTVGALHKEFGNPSEAKAAFECAVDLSDNAAVTAYFQNQLAELLTM